MQEQSKRIELDEKTTENENVKDGEHIMLNIVKKSVQGKTNTTKHIIKLNLPVMYANAKLENVIGQGIVKRKSIMIIWM